MEEIRKDFIDAIKEFDYLDKVLEFKCYSECSFTYGIEHQLNDTEIELTIITDEIGVIFLKEENIQNLLSTKGIKFIHLTIRDSDEEIIFFNQMQSIEKINYQLN